MQTQESPQADTLKERTLEFVDSLRLADVHFLKTSAERSGPAHDLEDETKYSADFSLSVDVKDDHSAIRVCAKVSIELDVGDVDAEVAVVYEANDGELDEIPDEVLEMFVNRVAFMAAFPYLRAEVASLTGKVFGTPLHMPILTQADVPASSGE